MLLFTLLFTIIQSIFVVARGPQCCLLFAFFSALPSWLLFPPIWKSLWSPWKTYEYDWQSILGNQCKFCFPASVEGSKLNFKIQKGRMLVGLIPVWDILLKKIEEEFEFELASFILKCSVNPEANHCRKGCKAKIKINWHIFKFLYFISIYSGCISSHKSFL